MLAVPLTSKTCGGCVFVSMVSAIFGFLASAATFGALGAVHTTICAPFQ